MLAALALRRPRQWGACWLALLLWRELELDQFWSKRLGVIRKGTRWDQVLFVLVAYRLLAPGSEWRLHRERFLRSALADLLGEDAGLAEIHKLYRCHDQLLTYKQAVFDHLTARWRDLFNISYDVLLYNLTSTYFEADPPFPEGDKRRFGYSRDHRPDCVQIVIALVVTSEGLPLAYDARRRTRSSPAPPGAWSSSRSPLTALHSTIGSIATNCGKPDRAKGDICYAPTSSRKTRPSCGAIICCWSQSRRHSRT